MKTKTKTLPASCDDYQAFPLQGAEIEAGADVWGGELPRLVVNKHLLAGLRLLIRAHATKPGAAVRYRHRHEDRRLGEALEELGLGSCGMAAGGRGCWAIGPRGREVLLAATAALGPLLPVMQKQREERRERCERARLERAREFAELARQDAGSS